MKVLMVTTFQEGCGGGEGLMAYELSRALSHRCDVAIVCTGFATEVVRESSHLTILRLNTEMRGEVTGPYWNVRNLAILERFVDDFRPDIIHGHDCANTDVILQNYANRHGIPFIYTGHVLPTKLMVFMGSSPRFRIPMELLQRTLVNPYMRSYLRRCERIVALNRYSRQDHLKLVPARRLVVIPNARDLRRFNLKKTVSVADPEVQIIFTGNIVERKNQLFLLEMMKFLPRNVRLLLLGNQIAEEYARRVKDFIAKNGLENVRLMGVPPHEIARYLQESVLFVSASTVEVQSLAVIEALASGTPVVGLRNETIGELIDGTNGIKLSRNATPEELAAAVTEVLGLSPADYRAMSAAARETARPFNWDSTLDRTLAMYDEAIASYRPGRLGRNTWGNVIASLWVAGGRVANDFAYVVRFFTDSSLARKLLERLSLSLKPKEGRLGYKAAK